RLLLGVVGGGADIAEVLGPGDLARDLAHLLEVLALHAALALIELGRDRVEAGLGEAAHYVFVLLVVTREARDHHDNGETASLFGAGVVGRNARAPHGELNVPGDDTLGVRDNGLGEGDAGRQNATHRRKSAESQDFSAAQRIEHGSSSDDRWIGILTLVKDPPGFYSRKNQR